MNISTELTEKFASFASTEFINTEVSERQAEDESEGKNIFNFAFLNLGLSIVFLSLSSILTKILMADLNPEAIIFNRFWIATAILAGFFFIKRVFIDKTNTHLKKTQKEESWQWSDWLFSIGAGICLAGTLIIWAWSFDYTTVAHSCLLHYQNPIFATLGAWLLFGQSFDRKFLFGLVLTVTGASIISLEDLHVAQGTFFGDEIALLSGIVFSAELLLIEKLRERLSTLVVTMSTCFFAGLFAFPFALFNTLVRGESLFPTSLSGWILIISLGFIVQVVGHFLFYHSLKQISSGFASIALMLDISIGTFLAWIIFAEQLTVLDWLSFPVLFLGIYLAKSGKGAKKDDGLSSVVQTAN